MELNFIIKNDMLVLERQKETFSGNVNFYRCKFEILENNDFLWICVFKKGDTAYRQVVENGECVIPQEVLLGKGEINIGCYATSTDGMFKRISTNWISVKVSEGAYSESTVPEIPEKDVWETLVLKNIPLIGENGNWYIFDTEKMEYVDSGKSSIGEKGEKGDKGDTGLPGTTNAANALRGRAQGQIVTITDVSPIEHKIDAIVKSKNMAIKVTYRDTTANNGAIDMDKCKPLEKGKIYTISWDTPNTGVNFWVVWLSNYRQGINSSVTQTCDGKRHSYTFKLLEHPPRYGGMVIQVSSSAPTSSGFFSNFMIEEGEAATEYTPYIDDVSSVNVGVRDADGSYKEVLPNQDGILELSSSYPSMEFLAKDTGAVVDAAYNRDINKAFLELSEKFTNAIISLGGNV